MKTKTLKTELTKLCRISGLLILSILLILSHTTHAQTPPPPPPTNFPWSDNPTVTGGLQEIVAAINSNTNILYEVHALYAPGLENKYGGGLGVFYPLNTYVYTGIRLDYVDGGFYMPSGSAGLQLPLKLGSWLKVTPFTYAGIGAPISGAKILDLTIPGHVRNNNGEATAILGYGLAVQVYAPQDGRWNIDLVYDRETWSGFHGQQNRFGLLFHRKF